MSYIVVFLLLCLCGKPIERFVSQTHSVSRADKYGLLKASSSEAYAFVINVLTSGNWFSIARFLTQNFTN